MKPSCEHLIQKLEITTRLAEFAPMAGESPPLGLATEGSDIDIACTSPKF